ncbi:MAG: nuclear transport factor 2 family protein [Burkholderiales bacterium]|nr:MAG: nuclear transport factor 2 family protein [Burkholderiales bacterium]
MSRGAVERARAYFESISPEALRRIDEIYAADAYFKDPFNEVRGIEPIRRIFAHMFDQVDSPRFVVREVVAEGSSALLTWDFLFRARRLGRAEQVIHGASHLRFDAAGRIEYHRDYWDAAEELYEKIPLLGGLMRLLRRKAAS